MERTHKEESNMGYAWKVRTGYYYNEPDEFRPDMEKAYQMTDHPCRDIVFSMASDYGENRLPEVDQRYRELCELVRIVESYGR